jgi:methanogenic corrinoid protein MtbC1
VHGVLSFLKEQRMPLVAPEVLGLPARTGQGSGVLERSRELFEQHLLLGDEEGCRRIAIELFLAGASIAKIGDELIAGSFHRIGHLWECGDVAVFQERRACEVGKHVLHECRQWLPPVPATAPLAIGGTPSGDQYELSSQLVELVLRENGWRTSCLGCNLPLSTVAHAVGQVHPQLLWLSVSHTDSPEDFASEYRTFVQSLTSQPRIALGGRALTNELFQSMEFGERYENLQTLAAAVHLPRPHDSGPATPVSLSDTGGA